MVAKLKRRRSAKPSILAGGGSLPSVSVVLAAYNEEATIERRLRELLGLIAASALDGEVIVVSDGSTDRTEERADAWALRDDRVQVVALDANLGKATALSEGCALARHEIVVFADARQSWAPDALASLLANWAGEPHLGRLLITCRHAFTLPGAAGQALGFRHIGPL